MFQTIATFFRAHTHVTVLVSAIIYSHFLFMLPDSFKLGLLGACIMGAFLFFVTRDFFTSLFIVFVLSAFFLYPSKNYTFTYAYPFEYKYEFLSTGIFETVAVTVSDILGSLLVLFFLRERIKSAKIIHMFNTPSLIGILVGWFIYYIFSLISAINQSIFPFYSLNLILHSSKMVLAFVGIRYLFQAKKRFVSLFYIVLVAILFFQSITGVRQFVFGLSSGGSVQKNLSADVEERTGFARVEGITVHPNSNAFMVSLLSIMLLPFILKNKNFYGWVLLFSVMNILFTQSRGVWLILLTQLALVLVVYWVRIRLIFISLLRNIRFIFTLIVVLCCVLLIAIPRLSYVSVFFSEDGGGGLRKKMIEDALVLLWQSPWIGYGMGTNTRIFLSKMLDSYASTFPYPIHFAFLQIALESGLLAAICFFIPFYIILRARFVMGIAAQLRVPDQMSVICGSILICGHGLVQPLYPRAEHFLIGIFLGFAVANIPTNKKLL